jgi:tRNA pseudouridine38-40 synthase
VGTKVKHTVREIFSAECIEHNWDELGDFPWIPSGAAAESLRLIEFRLCGKGFLKQMVRNIAGTLVDIGKGNLEVEDMKKILASKKRSMGGPTAPGEGLFLDTVVY